MRLAISWDPWGSDDEIESALKLMEGGPSKINPPNSHPSNPVLKAATAAQGPRPPKRVHFTLPSDELGQIKETFKEPQQQETNKTEHHEINKTAVIIGVVGVAALLILASR